MLPDRRILTVLASVLFCASAAAQTPSARFTPPVVASTSALPTAPSASSTHTFHDPTWHLSFDYPANWTFAHADHEISTFHLDARSAPRSASVRAVAALPENPFPASTFSGAYLYFSVIPHASAAFCTQQAAPPASSSQKPPAKPTATHVNDIPFTHGHDEVKDICTVQRDEIYTTLHRGACYRFDLSINNFCGGEVSGVKDITPIELEQIRVRLESVLSTVRFDPK